MSDALARPVDAARSAPPGSNAVVAVLAFAGIVLARMTTDFSGHPLPAENAFKVVMAIGAGAAVLAFVVASFLPRQDTAAQVAPPADGPVDAAEVIEANV